jgi:hypothetical protein
MNLQKEVCTPDSTNYSSAMPAALVLDNSNNVIVTGSALTVKYDTNGNQLWTAPYAGSALTADTNGNVAVTGFGTSFDSVKINPSGTNLWEQTYPSACGASIGQAIAADQNGDFYVAGSYPSSCENGLLEYELLIIKYSSNGSQLWSATYNPGGLVDSMHVGAAALDAVGDYSLVADFNGVSVPIALQYSGVGTLNWVTFLNQGGINPNFTLAIDKQFDTIVAGESPYAFNGMLEYYYTVIKLNAGGGPTWTNYFPQTPVGSSAVSSIAIDSANNSYVTGYSPGPNGTNNIVTIKYSPNGNQLWLQSYNGLNAGNAAGNAIAVDKNGNVYVAGYETLPGGGTGIVTIKYIPISIQRQTNGTVLIETQGSPGESFDIQASSDLLNWLDLGTILADTNGLMQFDDTNAPNFPARFYYTKPK